MYKALAVFVLVIVGFVVANPTHAAGVRAASDVAVPATEAFVDNQYIVAGRATLEGTASKDLTVVAGRAVIRGTVTEDVLVLGGESVSIEGVVLGDVRVFGGDVRIAGRVTGDVVAVGGTVHVAPEAQVVGELLIVAGTAYLDSTIAQNARVVAGRTTVAGTVTCTADVTTERLVLTEKANVSGTIVYFSPREAEQQSGATVTGSVTFNRIASIKDTGIVEKTIVSFLNFWIVLRFVTTLLVAFFIVYIFRVFAERTTQYVLGSFGITTLTGALVMIGLPIAAIIMFASLILLPVAVLTFLAYVFVAIITSAVAGIAVGVLLYKAFFKQTGLTVSFRAAALGVTVLAVIQFVPVVGELTRFVFFLAAFGAIWRYVYTSIRGTRPVITSTHP